IKLKLRSRGFIYFERDDLLAIAGTSESSLNTPILPHDIGGMITVLEQEEFLDYAKKQSLTYYLLSGLHDGLNLCTEDEEDEKPVPLVIAYYCPSWENKKSGIIGYSVITEIERPLFKSILEQELPEDSALSREDLLLYQTYSKDERIGELKLSKIFMFPSPLPISSNKWVSSTILADHLIGMIKTNGCNSAYLDIDSVRNILNQKGSYYSLPTVKEDDILPISKRNFKVALTFANDHRPLAKEVAEILTHHLGTNSVFYDDYYKSELAQVGLNEVLGKIYRRQSKLIVPFLSKNYKNRKWCNLEWRYISDMLFDSRLKKKLMPLKLDNSKIPNLLEQDGYVDISEYTPLEIAQTILKRLSTMK
ncbi:MAG: TIR domain-containing protein, partial [Flavobacterium sp.]